MDAALREFGLLKAELTAARTKCSATKIFARNRQSMKRFHFYVLLSSDQTPPFRSYFLIFFSSGEM